MVPVPYLGRRTDEGEPTRTIIENAMRDPSLLERPIPASRLGFRSQWQLEGPAVLRKREWLSLLHGDLDNEVELGEVTRQDESGLYYIYTYIYI